MLTNWIPADQESLTAFVIMCILMIGVIFRTVWVAGYKPIRFFWIAGIYLVVYSGIVISGLPAKYILPLFPLLFLSVFVAAVSFAFSNFGTAIINRLEIRYLIGFQAFRIPLEIILHRWSELGTIPPTMTWTGQNIDILSGILALIAFFFKKEWVRLNWAVNSIGFVLLLNTLRVVNLSSPFPFSLALEHPLQLVAHFPYALIGPLFVGVALSLHLMTFRKLTNHRLNDWI